MSRNQVRDLIDKFVEDLDAAIEDRVDALVGERIKAIADSFGGRPMKASPARQPAKKKSRPRRPCPVEGCDQLAAPRYHMVCKRHNDELTIDEIDAARSKAERPGGLWYKLGLGKHAATDRRKAAKSAG